MSIRRWLELQIGYRVRLLSRAERLKYGAQFAVDLRRPL
jgi:hypothetical protein